MKPVASILGIPQENIFANQLLFGSSGQFLGFDENEPTSRSGGKATAVQQIKKVSHAHVSFFLTNYYVACKADHKFFQDYGYKALTMIGDGATDFEVRKISDISL